jgi:hypothetical protein
MTHDPLTEQRITAVQETPNDWNGTTQYSIVDVVYKGKKDHQTIPLLT